MNATNPGNNVVVSGCSSHAPGTITIEPLTGGSNAGYGVVYASDPDSILSWL